MWAASLTPLIIILCLMHSIGESESNCNTTSKLQDSTCPTWTFCENNTCKCGSHLHDTVFCRISEECQEGVNVSVLFGFCMTQNSGCTDLVVGACPYNYHAHTVNPYLAPYLPVANETEKLDNSMCTRLGGYRTGQLCGQCVDGYSPPVYSYYPQCFNCTSGTNNWPKYLAVSLLPTTLFFLGAITFRFRATSPQLNGYIMICQMLTSPIVLRHVVRSYRHNKHRYGIAGDLYFASMSIWNLDFFRMLYSPFCLHPNASTLQVLSLDYIIAAYPLGLIILTYTLVRLHYHNCTLVVWLWRPFISCFARCRRQWDIQNSLMDAFATFLLLSYVKFLSVSFDILQPTFLWNMRHEQQKTVLYYDGTVEYFGRQHLPYALLAVTIFILFTLFPILLLCLYPCRCFQKFLNRYHLRNQALHAFMDTFQGCFKDGTQGTTDCRFFASVLLATRVGMYFAMGFSEVSFTYSIHLTTFLVVIVMLLTMFRPYKIMFYNKLDAFFLLLLITYFDCFHLAEDYNTKLVSLVNGSIVLLICILTLVGYPLCLLMHHIWKKSRRLQLAMQAVMVYFQRSADDMDVEEPLPVRVVMSEATPLLHSGSK